MLYIYAKGHHLGELGTASSTLTVIIVWNESLCSVAKLYVGLENEQSNDSEHQRIFYSSS